MRIINVVEIVDNNIQGIESFGVFDESKVQEVVDKAEADFIAKAKENGCILNDEEMQEAVGDGYWENRNYAINLTWSDIKKGYATKIVQVYDKEGAEVGLFETERTDENIEKDIQECFEMALKIESEDPNIDLYEAAETYLDERKIVRIFVDETVYVDTY
jgi:hypothetical protein